MNILPQNYEKFNYLNILQYHKKGYTGKGIKIGMFDNDFNVNKTFFKGKVKPMPNCDLGKSPDWSHGVNTAQVLRQVAPDSEIYLLPQQYPSKPDYAETMDWCAKNNVMLINKSMSGWASDYEINIEKKAVENGITLIVSAGNKYSGDNTLGSSAKTDNWISIGAVEFNNGTIERVDYSSTGKQLDVMSFTNIWVNGTNDYKFAFTGTSASAPMITGMLAIWYQRYYEINKRYPTQQESFNYLINNCVDLYDAGHDNYTGYGVFRMPEFKDEIVLKIGSKQLIRKTECSEQIINMDVAPFIKDGRTMVPLRFVSEQLGANILWDGGKQEVTIIK